MGHPSAEDLIAARSSVGMVFQHPRDQFVAATVGADVAFGPGTSDSSGGRSIAA